MQCHPRLQGLPSGLSSPGSSGHWGISSPDGAGTVLRGPDQGLPGAQGRPSSGPSANVRCGSKISHSSTRVTIQQ